MSRQIHLTLADQLGALPLSTRVKNSLSRMLDFPGRSDWNFDTILRMAHDNRAKFEAEFLRTPGAGRKSLNELLEFIDDIPDNGDYTGRTVAITFTDADNFQWAIGQACNHMAAETKTYQALRKLQSLLDAGTIHIEQDGDTRPFFKD